MSLFASILFAAMLLACVMLGAWLWIVLKDLKEDLENRDTISDKTTSSNRNDAPPNLASAPGNLSYSPLFRERLRKFGTKLVDSTSFYHVESKTHYFSIESYCQLIAEMSPHIKSIFNIVENPLEFHDNSFQQYLASLLDNNVAITYALRPQHAENRFNELLRSNIVRRSQNKNYDFDDLFRVISVDNDILFSRSVGFVISDSNHGVVGFSSIRNEENQTALIYSLSSRETYAHLEAVVTHLVEELVELGDAEEAQTKLEWLHKVGMLDEREFLSASNMRITYQAKLRRQFEEANVKSIPLPNMDKGDR